MATIFDNNDNAYQLKTLAWAEEGVECLRNQLEERIKNVELEKLKLFGSPTSMFYGLKCPGKYKCIEYIGDKYNLIPDLIQTIQDLIMKKNYEDNIKQYFKIYTNPIENRRCNLRPRDWKSYSITKENGQELITVFANNYYPMKNSDKQWKKNDNSVVICYRNGEYKKCNKKFRSISAWEDRPKRHCCEAGIFNGIYNIVGPKIYPGKIKIGGIVFDTDNYGFKNQTMNPILNRTMKGQRYNPDIFEVIDKKTLYEAIVNNCRHSDKIKLSNSKKELFAHLIKYG